MRSSIVHISKQLESSIHVAMSVFSNTRIHHPFRHPVFKKPYCAYHFLSPALFIPKPQVVAHIMCPAAPRLFIAQSTNQACTLLAFSTLCITSCTSPVKRFEPPALSCSLIVYNSCTQFCSSSCCSYKVFFFVFYILDGLTFGTIWHLYCVQLPSLYISSRLLRRPSLFSFETV